MDISSQHIELRSKQDIIARCREVIHRARRKFLKKNSRPCPLNCQFATQHGNEVTGCKKCHSYNPELCIRDEEFVSIYTKEELYQQFRDELFDKHILFRKYPAIGVLLWVLGVVDTNEEIIDHSAMEKLEKRVIPK